MKIPSECPHSTFCDQDSKTPAISYISNYFHSHVEPTSHAVPLVNVTREDAVRPSLSNEDALRNAPSKANGLFLVPKIVE